LDFARNEGGSYQEYINTGRGQVLNEGGKLLWLWGMGCSYCGFCGSNIFFGWEWTIIRLLFAYFAEVTF
jgi:hypothetical protein